MDLSNESMQVRVAAEMLDWIQYISKLPGRNLPSHLFGEEAPKLRTRFMDWLGYNQDLFQKRTFDQWEDFFRNQIKPRFLAQLKPAETDLYEGMVNFLGIEEAPGVMIFPKAQFRYNSKRGSLDSLALNVSDDVRGTIPAEDFESVSLTDDGDYYTWIYYEEGEEHYNPRSRLDREKDID